MAFCPSRMSVLLIIVAVVAATPSGGGVDKEHSYVHALHAAHPILRLGWRSTRRACQYFWLILLLLLTVVVVWCV